MSEYNPHAIFRGDTHDFLIPATAALSSAQKAYYEWDPHNDLWDQKTFCFETQQAIETTLKAILMLNDIDVNSDYRTHNINELVYIVEHETDFGYVPDFIRNKAYLIGSWGVSVRYRDDLHESVEYTEQIDDAYMDESVAMDQLRNRQLRHQTR